MLESITATEIIRQSQQGYSIKPFILRAEDDRSYFVKGLEKAGGPALISEVIGAELGRYLGLPIPPWRLINIPADLIEFSVIPNVTDLRGGLAFASQAVRNASDFNVSHINSIPVEMRRLVLLFDWWIRNEDRCLGPKGGNVNLILDAAGDLGVIDHNLAFDGSFDCNAFTQNHVFRERGADFRDYVIRQDYAQMLGEALSKWGTITALLPDEWVYRDSDHVDETQPTLASRLEMLEIFREEPFWGAL
jgi:hypothetical protein